MTDRSITQAISQADRSITQADTSVSQADRSISQADTSKHISKELIGTSIELDWEKVDGSIEQYGSAQAWKREWSGFPDEFYPVLEAFSNAPPVDKNVDKNVNTNVNETPKQIRNRIKKDKRIGRGKKGRNKQ
jgi:hypothetical protein